LIEVKQASIYLSARLSGNREALSKDLERNIVDGVVKIEKTKDAILSRKYKKLSIFDGVEKFEKLLVVYSPLYHANSIIKDIVRSKIDAVGDFHIINSAEFESLLEVQHSCESLYTILETKNVYQKYQKMDFNEFLHYLFGKVARSSFLLNKYNEYFSKFDGLNKH